MKLDRLGCLIRAPESLFTQCASKISLHIINLMSPREIVVNNPEVYFSKILTASSLLGNVYKAGKLWFVALINDGLTVQTWIKEHWTEVYSVKYLLDLEIFWLLSFLLAFTHWFLFIIFSFIKNFGLSCRCKGCFHYYQFWQQQYWSGVLVLWASIISRNCAISL